MATLKLFTLGTLSITVDDVPLARLTNQKAQALLVYLLCQRDALFSRDHLQTLLWSDKPLRKGRNSLRQTLYHLQQTLPPDTLILEQLNIGFNRACDHWFDIDHAQVDPAYYRGEFLQGFVLRGADVWDEWLAIQRESVSADLIQKWEQSAENHPNPIPLLQRVIALNPYREQPHRRLMALHLRNGDRAAAIAQYETLAALLADEIGVEPAAETQALYRRAMTAAPAHNLPHPATLTPFIGRTQALSDLQTLLRDAQTRLITLLGLGGVGKTRLALTCAAANSDHFADGVCLVDLTHADTLTIPLANALGIQLSGQDSAETQLLAYLKERHLLLLLDNFEAVHATPTLSFIQQILRAAPQVTLLITSRERLRLHLEQVYRVDGLGVEDEAVALFEQVARRVEFQFSAEIQPMRRICELVEGMPLAIELAAAWTSDLSCQSIADQIARDLAILRSTYHDTPERHHSLRVVFQHTWRRLDPHQQTVFRALTILHAGFDATAAQVIASASPATLRALTDKALLQPLGDNRFRIHERLRQFVQTEWQEPHTINLLRDRHADYYSDWLAQRRDQTNGRAAKAVFAQLDGRFANVVAAWRWAVQSVNRLWIERNLPILPSYLQAMGRQVELIDLLETGIAAVSTLPTDDTNQRLLARLLRALGLTQRQIGRFVAADQSLQQAIHYAQQIEDLLLTARCRGDHAAVQAELGQLDRAVLTYDALIDLFRQLDNNRYRLIALISKGLIERRLGDYPAADTTLTHAVALAEQLDFAQLTASAYNSLAAVALSLGEYDRAYHNYTAARQLPFEDRVMLATLEINLAQVALRQQQLAIAAQHLESTETLASPLDEADVHGLLQLSRGELATLHGDTKTAQQAFAESAAIFERLNNLRFGSEAQLWLGRLAADAGEFGAAFGYLEKGLRWAEGLSAESLAIQCERAITHLRQQTTNPAPHRATLQAIIANPATHHHIRQRAAQFL